jgi:TolA-binding protein
MCGARLAAVPPRALAAWHLGRALTTTRRRRIEVLRQQVEANARALEERLARIEDRRPLVELAGQIEAVRAELAKMRGQLEVLANQIDTADKRQKDLYVDIDTRLRKLEQPKEPAAGDKPAAENAVPAAETKGYEAALNQFGSATIRSRFRRSRVFSSRIRRASSPRPPSTGSATRISRSATTSRSSPRSKSSASWPDDAKAPDAMLNIATSQEALGDRRGAQKTPKRCSRSFRDATAAARSSARAGTQR